MNRNWISLQGLGLSLVWAMAFVALAGLEASAQQTAQPSAPPAQVQVPQSQGLPPGSNQAPLFQVPAQGAGAPAGEGDIRDIRGAISIEEEFPWALVVGWSFLGTIVLISGGLIAWHFLSRAKPLLPHERTLLSLQKARDEANPEEGRKYAYTVSEVVRHYIEERFNARAAHTTTEEFLRDLTAHPTGSLSGYTPLLEQFMTATDMVKFAGVQLTLEQIDELHQTSVTFVKNTAPQEGKSEPAPANQVAGSTPGATEPPVPSAETPLQQNAGTPEPPPMPGDAPYSQQDVAPEASPAEGSGSDPDAKYLPKN